MARLPWSDDYTKRQR